MCGGVGNILGLKGPQLLSSRPLSPSRDVAQLSQRACFYKRNHNSKHVDKISQSVHVGNRFKMYFTIL